MIYIASPYTHPEPAVRNARYVAAQAYTHELLTQAIPCFSPIVYGHQFHLGYGAPQEMDYWQKINEHMLKHSTAVHMLLLPGWEDSAGCRYELALASHLHLDILYVVRPYFEVAGE